MIKRDFVPLEEFISTLVDKLLDLINNKGEIEIEEAAAELTMPVSQIEEWAKALEQQNLIQIVYSLHGLALKSVKPTKEDVSNKIQKIYDLQKRFDKELLEFDKLMQSYREKPHYLEKQIYQTKKEMQKAISKAEAPILKLKDRRARRDQLLEFHKDMEKKLEVLQQMKNKLHQIEKEEHWMNKLYKKFKQDVSIVDKKAKNVKKEDTPVPVDFITKTDKEYNALIAKKNEFIEKMDHLQDEVQSALKVIKKQVEIN